MIDVRDDRCSIGADGVDFSLALLEYFWVLRHGVTEGKECC